MARGVNKVILVGNLGDDPDVRYTTNGAAVANTTIATSEQWTDRQTGEKHEKTEWHRVVFFGRIGEIAGEYLRKGSQVYVEGKLQTRKWQDQNGQDRYTTEIVASDLQMLGGKRDGNNGNYNDNGGNNGNYGGGNNSQRGGGNNSQRGGGRGNGGRTGPANNDRGNSGGSRQGGQFDGRSPHQGGVDGFDGFDDFDDDIPF